MNLSARMPTEIKQVMSNLRKIAPCIIAGGAVRDTLNKRNVKDIDVFMDAAHKKEFLRNASGYRKLGQEQTEYKLANVVDEVYETRTGYPWPVQVIFCNVDPEEYVSKYFDFGICKAWYDGERIRCHKDFVKDVNNKTITMVLDDKTFKRAYPNQQYALKHMRHHGERIQMKYPTFSIIMPDVV